MNDASIELSFTPFNPCGHGTLQIMEAHALGVTAGCLHCDETFDIPAAIVDEKYYHFTHYSPKGQANDMELLIHYKIIER